MKKTLLYSALAGLAFIGAQAWAMEPSDQGLSFEKLANALSIFEGTDQSQHAQLVANITELAKALEAKKGRDDVSLLEHLQIQAVENNIIRLVAEAEAQQS